MLEKICPSRCSPHGGCRFLADLEYEWRDSFRPTICLLFFQYIGDDQGENDCDRNLYNEISPCGHQPVDHEFEVTQYLSGSICIGNLDKEGYAYIDDSIDSM